MITHWDEIDGVRRERGHIAATWQSLTGAHSVTAGVQRISVDPGRWATPLHLEGSEEEIFYVLSGTGVSVQWDGENEEAFGVGPGDCLVHLALEHAHTIGAGDDGLVVLAFGQRHYAANTLLPRAGVSWLGPTWVLEGAPDDHPWAREAAVGPPTWTALAERPPRIVNVADVTVSERAGSTVAHASRRLGGAAGSAAHRPRPLRRATRAADEPSALALGGGGDLRRPRWNRIVVVVSEPACRDGEIEEYPVRAGCTIARPAGTQRAHAIRAGDDALTVLAFGTRDPNDITYYPRSGKISFRGVGVIGRVEQVEYWDGED